MLTINKVGLESIPIIQVLSNEIWKKVYPAIVPMGQIEYLLNVWHSEEALTEQMVVEGHQFVLIEWNKETIGYASYVVKDKEDPYRFRLNKLYVQPEVHGKGIGKSIVHFVTNEIKPLGATVLELNVHKRNPAVAFYKHIGFVIAKEEVTEIAHGYLLDDFIMELDLTKKLL